MSRIRLLCSTTVLAAVLTALAAPLTSRAAAQAAGTADAHMARPTVHAVRLSGTIQLDGVLDDAGWAAAPVIDRFIQKDPNEGEPVSERTEVRIVYDDEALYIGARLYDESPITTRLGRRDMPLLDADWFGVVIDS